MAVYQAWPYIEVGRISRLAVYQGWPYIEVGGISRWPYIEVVKRSEKNNNKETGTNQKLTVPKVQKFPKSAEARNDH